MSGVLRIPEPPAATLPGELGFTLASSTRVRDGGRTLLAGERVLRLSATALDLVRGPGPVAGGDANAARLTRLLLDAGAADPWWPDPPPPDPAVDDVTVVVPVRDRPEALARLLRGLPPHLPVVVVDDGSSDSAATARACAATGARLLRHPESRGPAAARNTGLAAVETPYVAFCDSDVEPVPGWLGVLRRHLDDPVLAVVAPRVHGRAPGAGDGWLDRYEQARSSLDLGPTPAAVRVRGRVAYLPSACLLARVAALGDGFDPALRSGEDVDLVWRLLAAGWRVRYDPAARVRHDHRTTLGPWLARKAFYGSSAAPLSARHPGAVAPLVVSPWSAALTVAVLAQRRWSAPVAAAVAGAAVVGVRRRLATGAHPWRTAGVLVGHGAAASLRQAGTALTRHHWPLAALACLVSGRARRAVLVAAVADAWLDHRKVRPRLGLPPYLLARRLDDLAYGAGLWRGAWRERSVRALLPGVSRSTAARLGRRGYRDPRHVDSLR